MSVAAWQCRVIQAGVNLAPVAASHGLGIEPCRQPYGVTLQARFYEGGGPKPAARRTPPKDGPEARHKAEMERIRVLPYC